VFGLNTSEGGGKKEAGDTIKKWIKGGFARGTALSARGGLGRSHKKGLKESGKTQWERGRVPGRGTSTNIEEGVLAGVKRIKAGPQKKKGFGRRVH